MKLLMVLILFTFVACRGADDEGLQLASDEGRGGGAPPAALPPTSADGGFTDVTLAAGIDFQHRLPGDDIENIVDSLGAGAAFADLDGDGWLDLVVLGGPRSPVDRDGSIHAGLRVYRNRTDGHFEDVTGRSGIPAASTATAILVADYDGDGDRDVYLIDRGPNRLYQNRGDGVFTDVTREAGVGDDHFGVGGAFFDVDGDLDLDLYVANYIDFDSYSTPYYGPDGFPGPRAYSAERDVLYRNLGDGRFEDVSESSGISTPDGRGMSVVAADFNDDAAIDVFVANDATANFLLLGDGKGRFTEAGITSGLAMSESGEATAAMGGDLGDVDGDGHLDLAVSDTAFGALYRRQAPGLYSDIVMSSGLARLVGQYVSWGQNLIDFDNDGDLDLYVANGGLHHLVGWEDVLVENDGNGRFEDASLSGGQHFVERLVSRSSIIGDYDNDGDLDVFVTTLAGLPVLLRNDEVDPGSWLTLDLSSPHGRDPFGARIEIIVAGRSSVAVSRCPTGYLGQSDSRVHFGLGPGVERVDRLRVLWPSGAETVLEDVATGRVLRLEENGRS